jgi:hypothetical protein
MKNLKTVSADLRGAIRSNYQRTVVGAGLLMVGGAASATPAPTGAAAAWADLETAANEALTNAWPIVIILTVGFIGIKLFKKAANKAT